MLKNKKICLISFALAALLFMTPAVSASELQDGAKREPQDLIDITQIPSEDLVYSETAQAEYGDFVNEINVMAHKYYPMTYNVAFDQTGAKFLEFTVKTGDKVKKGDVLARFTVDKREAEITRLSLDLQRAQEQMNAGIREREENIVKTRTALEAAADEYEKEILTLTLKKYEIELQQYKHRQQYSINQKSKAYNEEHTRRTTDVLVSPADGTVTDYAFKRVDEAVIPGETLVTVKSGESMLLLVQNAGLRYNMPIQLQVGSKPNETYLSGRVVVADDAIPQNERSGFALIELDPYDKEKYSVQEPSKIIAEDRLDNVLLIPNKAVRQEADKKYVLKYTDGVVQKRYIYPVMNNYQYTYVLEGVEESETLILN